MFCDEEEHRQRERRALGRYELVRKVPHIRQQQADIAQKMRRFADPKRGLAAAGSNIKEIDLLGRHTTVQINPSLVRASVTRKAAKHFGISVHTVDKYWKRGRSVMTRNADRLRADLEQDLRNRGL